MPRKQDTPQPPRTPQTPRPGPKAPPRFAFRDYAMI
ncbi:MAG: hypothetical protein HLUCCA08_08235 [Rhodobacteraceae bacterium HLUCCA08]|nr:MAG: hypothetical protein HLUCCA08_08235 [Rhodobacteraceae bacterium HLUCCA08]